MISSKKTIQELIAYFSKKWHLYNIRSLIQMPLINNYVALAYSEKYKIEVVLKILISPTHEPEALTLFDGNGCVKLLDYDPEKKGLLLEYINPGTSLKTLFPENDAKAVEITAEVIKKIQEKNLITKAKGFKTVNQWLALLHTFCSQKIPEHFLTKARQLSETLRNSNPTVYFLHGDLHHENILQQQQAWVAIDPKGVIGPLEFEVSRFIMNPIPELLEQNNAKEIMKARIHRFSEIFGFEKQHLLDWVFVHAVLSACWAQQDENNELATYFVSFAELIESICMM